MKTRPYWVRAELSDEDRSRLLGHFRPNFELVYCRCIIWVYGCTPEFTGFPEGAQPLHIVGRHVGEGHEAIVVELGKNIVTPSTKLLHITLSARAGVPPVKAGDIDRNAISHVTMENFGFVELQLQPVKQIPGQHVSQLLAA